MEKDYWLNKWQINDVAFHEKKVAADLIAYFDELHLQSGDRIFVPLCGKSKDMLWLAEKGFYVVGNDISPIACEDFFTELGITPQITEHSKFTKYQYNNIELFCGDLFDLTHDNLLDIKAVYDWKALIALPQKQRKKYLDHIVACLGKNIKILLLTRETSCNVKPPPFPITQEEVQALYGAYFDVKILKHQHSDNIPERLVKKGYTEMIEGVYLIEGVFA